jgi:hypothetical protein
MLFIVFESLSSKISWGNIANRGETLPVMD